MAVYQLDPISDPRWSDFIGDHPRGSVFHTPSWLEALRLTYGYEPVVCTTTKPGHPLQNGIVLCHVKSWLTGDRLVSLPFSDHCQALVSSAAELSEILDFLGSKVMCKSWKYVELRPRFVMRHEFFSKTELIESASYFLHTLDLRPSQNQLFCRFHKNSVQQMLRRAEREALVAETGRSTALLEAFYGLLLLTRRRQQLPPQPFTWFTNLSNCFAENMEVRVAFKGAQPIASILTLSHKRTLVYKYSCSDVRFKNLGATPFLLWQAIRDAKTAGAQEFDLGRSELDNPGLIAFKDHWGADRYSLIYYRALRELPRAQSRSWRSETVRRFFSMLPDCCLTTAGRLLYKHVG